MSKFLKYPHLERLISAEVEGILDGLCYIFYKIDGTNSSVWLDDDGHLAAGSRNRVLSIENDNAGFCAFAQKDEKLNDLLSGFPELTAYGEWLVPHSLKTYRDSAWRKFYIFDVFNNETQEFYDYDRYKDILDAYEKEMGAPELNATATYEEIFVRDFLTSAFIQKEKAKIINNRANSGGYDCWDNKMVPELLGRVWYEFVQEELMNFLKKHKNPKVNFRFLQTLVIQAVKKEIGI